jgi:hypothetical protein
MKIEDKINKYLKEGENWSGKVKIKWHPPEGLFKNGSPEEIASTVSQGANLKTAMARLNFFLNRGGSNVSPAIRKKVEKAKKILSGSKE